MMWMVCWLALLANANVRTRMSADRQLYDPPAPKPVTVMSLGVGRVGSVERASVVLSSVLASWLVCFDVSIINQLRRYGTTYDEYVTHA